MGVGPVAAQSSSTTQAADDADAAAEAARQEAERLAEEARRAAEEARRREEEAQRQAAAAAEAQRQAEAARAALQSAVGRSAEPLQAALDAAEATVTQTSEAASVARQDADAAGRKAASLHAQATIAAISANVPPPPPLETAAPDTFTPGAAAASAPAPVAGPAPSFGDPQQVAQDWVAKVKDDPLLKNQPLIFLDDPSQQLAGAVLVEQGDGRLLDPTSDPANPRVYGSLDEYRSGRALPEVGRATAAELAPIFATAPNSPERAAAIEAAGLGSSLAATPGTRGYTPERAAEDAKRIFDASFAGLTDMGTDVEALAAVLKPLNGSDLALLGEVFEDHYHEKLSTLPVRVEGDLSTALSALLDPNLSRTEAAATYDAALLHDKLGADGAGAVKVYEDASVEGRTALMQRFFDLYGGAESGTSAKDFFLAEMGGSVRAGSGRASRTRSYLDSDQLTRLQSLVQTTEIPTDAPDPLAAARAELTAAVQGISGDLSGANDVNAAIGRLERLSPEARALGLKDAALQAELEDLDPEERDQANAVLSGDEAAAAAASLRRASGPEGVRKILEAQTPDQLPGVLAAFEAQAGHSLESEVRGWGEEDIEVTLQLLRPPEAETPAQAAAKRLNLAIKDGNVEALRAELNASPQALDALAVASFNLYRNDAWVASTAYSGSYEQPKDVLAPYRGLPDIGAEPTEENIRVAREFVSTRLDAALDGREQVKLVDQLFARGAIDEDDPNATQEEIDRSREQLEAEQRDGVGMFLTGALQNVFKDGETDEERLNRTLAESQAALDAGEAERAQTAAGYTGQDVQTLQSSKDETAALATTAVSSAAVGGAVIATGGAVGLAAAGLYGAVGAASSAATYDLANGDAKGSEVARQGLIGAAAGLASGLPLGAAAGGWKFGLAQGVEQGAAAGAAGTATAEGTWDDGALNGLGEVATSAGLRGAAGGAAGAAFSAAVMVGGRLLRIGAPERGGVTAEAAPASATDPEQLALWQRALTRYLVPSNLEASVARHQRFGTDIVKKAVLQTVGNIPLKTKLGTFRLRESPWYGLQPGDRLQAALNFATNGSVKNEAIHVGGALLAAAQVAGGVASAAPGSVAANAGLLGLHLALTAVQRFNRARVLSMVARLRERGHTVDPSYRNWLGLDGGR